MNTPMDKEGLHKIQHRDKFGEEKEEEDDGKDTHMKRIRLEACWSRQ